MTTRETDTTVNDHMQERVSGIKPGNETAYLSMPTVTGNNDK